MNKSTQINPRPHNQGKDKIMYDEDFDHYMIRRQICRKIDEYVEEYGSEGLFDTKFKFDDGTFTVHVMEIPLSGVYYHEVRYEDPEEPWIDRFEHPLRPKVLTEINPERHDVQETLDNAKEDDVWIAEHAGTYYRVSHPQPLRDVGKEVLPRQYRNQRS